MRLTDHPKLTADICYFLGKVYRAVNWGKMSKARATSYDIFQHRIRTASNKNSVSEFLSKLCDGLNLQAPSIDPDLLEKLEFNADLVLNMLRKWSQYFVYRASRVSKDLKKKVSRTQIKEKIIKSILQKSNQTQLNLEKYTK
ncbi:MAG: hypothetical protein ACOC4M_04585 [Promethearchaeia archaeon]